MVYYPVKAAFSIIATKTLFGIWPSITFSQFSDKRPRATECVVISAWLIGYKAGAFRVFAG